VNENRHEIKTLLRYTEEQRIISQAVDVDGLFAVLRLAVAKM